MSFLIFINSFVVIVQSVVSICDPWWQVVCQASLSFTISQSLLKLLSMKSVMPQTSLSLSSPSPPAFDLFQHQGLFQ